MPVLGMKYLFANKKMVDRTCAIQIENQVSDAKQCGHQDGKVTVLTKTFLLRLTLFVMLFLELGVDRRLLLQNRF
jgi:isocitrate lyase